MGTCFSSGTPAAGAGKFYECHLYGKGFHSENAFKNHQTDSHPEAVYECFKCIRKYETKAARDIHGNANESSKR
jgi:hypothetical protein